ncbi:hypothetical protein MtrunA17_Chr3g0077991 [Medicago truncatula]|uniref:Uncharacterized protein n=1 Tax=Medicago truncatula TaxID=3880 RepID=A0A396IK90_MEDTR|nr:hypothetical protein MtrunA17_Chr3g0077991 [Medicago truncatula]
MSEFTDSCITYVAFCKLIISRNWNRRPTFRNGLRVVNRRRERQSGIKYK